MAKRNRAEPKTSRHTLRAGTLVLTVAGFIVGLVVLPSCQKQTLHPVAIIAEDMCSFCKMSISEKRYAAEFIDTEGNAFKFDDIGCMVNFLKQKRNENQIRANFVMDFNKREWIKAESAFYVSTSGLDTPMGGGIIAVNDQSSAQEAVSKYQGKQLRFDEVFNLK